MELMIDQEFKELMPPLAEDELSILSDSIVKEGCRDPINKHGGRMTISCTYCRKGTSTPCLDYIPAGQKTQPGFCKRPDMFRCTEAMKRKLPAISYSSLTDFIACRRRYYHRAVEGLQVKPQHLPEPIKLGKGWDLFIQHLYESEANCD